MSDDGDAAAVPEMRLHLRDIEERHGDILELEAAVQELHELFLDMAVLVEAQGEMVDSVERHVEAAIEYVVPAVKRTRKALEYHREAAWKRILLCPIACCFVKRGD